MLDLVRADLAELVLHDVEAQFGKKVRVILEKYRDGYTMVEIAKSEKMSYNQVTKLFTKVKKFVNSEVS